MADNINISDLSFEQIRTSLVDYLRNQETFKDYDFEGSAIRTIIDLLAYNTFYYGYYANMIANEMFLDTAKLENSMISLTKPLGYLVPKYHSSRTQIRLNNLSISQAQISRFSVFKGFANSGRPYFFYNIKPIPITLQNGVARTAYFDIFEGRSVTSRQLVEVNLTTQSFILEGDRIDPRTIVVEVQQSEGTAYSEWINYLTNPDSIVGPNTQIFFIERTKTGYAINFGKQTSSDVSSSNMGKMIEQGNKVYISYLTSSGEGANAISSFQFVADGAGLNVATPTTETTTLYPSKNGLSTPNLDEIRFFAPKSFAKQNRLVTKGDYYAILNELGYGSGNSNPDFAFKVFGGEEATPPVYGRVFVSLIDLNLTNNETENSQTEEINQILSVLKSKSVVSVLPEYIPPIEYRLLLTVSGSIPGANELILNKAKTTIRNKLFSLYGTKKYNQNVTKDDIIKECKNAVPELIISSGGGVFLTAIGSVLASGNQRKITFKNKLNSIKIIQSGSVVYGQNSGKFIYSYNANGSLNSLEPIGEFLSNEGIIILYEGKFTGPLTIEAKPTDEIFYAKN